MTAAILIALLAAPTPTISEQGGNTMIRSMLQIVVRATRRLAPFLPCLLPGIVLAILLCCLLPFQWCLPLVALIAAVSAIACLVIEVL